MCEEFGCLPSAALREWRQAPVGLLETIVEFRAYASAKHAYDTASDAKSVPQTPMVQLVKEIEFGLARQEIDKQKTDDH